MAEVICPTTNPKELAAETARNRYSEFFGLGCDCFAF